MKIDFFVEEYLYGKKFSNGEYFSINRNPIISRNDLLVKLAFNKTVLHLGCADHVALIAKKRSHGTYLHDLLAKSAKKLIGADKNNAALSEMKDLNMKNLFHVDDLPHDEKYDLVLIPDVIEHVDNVGVFLNDIKKYNTKKIVITTPNSYRLLNRRLFTKELVNTDHRYWFSPYTLAKILYENGFKIDNFYYTDKIYLYKPIQSYLKWRYPLCRDGLAVIISKNLYSD